MNQDFAHLLYNRIMYTPTIIRLRDPRLFDLAVYVTAALLGGVFLLLPVPSIRIPVTVLCVAYGLVYRFSYHGIHTAQHATLYLATQTLILTATMLLAQISGDLFNLLFVLLGIQAVLITPKRVGMVWVAAFYLITTIIVSWNRTDDSAAIYWVFNMASFFLTYVFAATVRQAEIARLEAEAARLENEQLLEELRSAQRQLHNLAVAEERTRLARDLHDSVKQQVFATTMQLGAARVLIEHDPEAARTHVVEAEQLAQQAGTELSLLIHELRPVALGDKGLAAALQAYTRDWSRQTGIHVTTHAEGSHSLPPPAEHALLRVAQEALANVARHSHATTVTVDLTYAADAVTLAIADNGRGFDVHAIQKGVGLDSMRERIEELGGRMQVDSQLGTGTRIVVHCGGANA